jgi:sugar lactone lactonase YvrE
MSSRLHDPEQRAVHALPLTLSLVTMINPRVRLTLLVATLSMAGVAGALRAEDYAITTFAGVTLTAGSADGTPGTFNNPFGIAIDSAKNLYVSDTTNHIIRKITPGRVVSTLAGSAGQSAGTDGTGSAARFSFPIGVAVDVAGNVYVADSRNSVIRKITPGGLVTTFAGAIGQFGSADGAAGSARFFLPCGVAVDGSGNVYVADTGNQTIRKITPDGIVSTLAGAAQQPGTSNGTGGAARFSSPWGIAVDGSGNLTVSDSGNHVIRRITAGGAVTTLAGVIGTAGSQDGLASSARFNLPRGLSIGTGGNVFVADYGNSVIRMITPSGVVSTVAGTPGITGAVDSVGAAARFFDTTDVVADGSTIYVVDSSNNLIRRGQPASAAALPAITTQPLDQEIAVGQSITFRVVATGSALTYQWLRNGTTIEGATNSTYTIASPQSGDSAAYSVRISGAGGSIDSGQANLSVTPAGTGPITITARPISQSVAVGQAVTFNVAASGSGLTYQWFRDGAALAGATAATYAIASAQTGDAGTYSVRITSGAVTETPTAKLVVGGATGGGATVTITSQPTGRIIEAGQSATFTVAATGSNLTYQWFKDGSAIAGANSASLSVSNAQVSQGGSYLVRVSSGAVFVDSNPATLTVIPPENPGPVGPTARLSNLSVRTAMASGQRLIVGFFVDGGSRQILARASGPALAALGLSGTMTDPNLELYSGSTLVLSNDNWSATLTDVFPTVGAFAFPAGSRDAAFVQSVTGSASVHAQGTGPGIVLVEAYDTGTGNTPRMTNLSARNRVGTGDDIMIAGFAVSGTGKKRLLIRAAGPALTGLGVTGVLVNPRLEVFSGPVKLNENEDWAANLAATFSSVGAFPFPAGSRDAALIVELDAGATYTVQVRGSDGGVGEALVEIYELP